MLVYRIPLGYVVGFRFHNRTALTETVSRHGSAAIIVCGVQNNCRQKIFDLWSLVVDMVFRFITVIRHG